MLFDFGKGKNGEAWKVVNDGVMGGRSQGQFTTNENSGILSGVLSLANKGGFSSVRSPVAVYRWGEYQGFILRVRGDGRTYKLTLRDTPYFTGLAHNADFITQKEQWIVVKVPFADFEPRYFGRPVEVDMIDPDSIRQVGVLLADKQAGPFQIELDWIKLY